MSSFDKKTAKKKYSAPKIETVELNIDEEHLKTCKTGGSTGPGSNNCNPGNVACYKQQPS